MSISVSEDGVTDLARTVGIDESSIHHRRDVVIVSGHYLQVANTITGIFLFAMRSRLCFSDVLRNLN